MKLSVKEAATILGCSARTVRGHLAQGRLPGVKRNGRWLVERRDLPLTDAQRRTLQAKAERVRRAVDDALPSRLARTHGDRARSLADLDAFRLGAELLAEVAAGADGNHTCIHCRQGVRSTDTCGLRTPPSGAT